MCAAHDLCNTASWPDLLCYPGHELCCRCTISQDYNILVFHIDTRVPTSAVERITLEVLHTRDLRDRRPIQGSYGADDDIGFACEGLSSEFALESANPLAPDCVPHHLEAHDVELAPAGYIVSFGYAHEIYAKVSILVACLFAFSCGLQSWSSSRSGYVEVQSDFIAKL